MKKALIITLSLIILAGIVFLLVIQTKKDRSNIKIGVILPLSGEPSVWGISMKQGIDHAVSQINSKDGINGKDIKLIYEDDKGIKNDGLAAIKKLIEVDKIKIILGVANSSVAKAIIPVIDEYNKNNDDKVIFVSGGASSPKLTGISPYFYRTWPSDNEEANAMANFIATKEELKNIAILYMNNDYGIDLMRSFSDKISYLDVKILLNESFSEEDTDMRSQLSKIKSVEPDAVYLVGNPKGLARCLVQAKEMGLKTQFLSTSAIIEPEVIKIALNASEGTLYTDASIDTSESNKIVSKFIDDFKKSYNQEPGMLAFTGYDSLLVVATAIKKVGESSQLIKDYLDNVVDFPSLGGKISFEKGDIKRPVRIGIIRNGKFELFNINQ